MLVHLIAPLTLLCILLPVKALAGLTTCQDTMTEPWFGKYSEIAFNTGRSSKWDDFDFLLRGMRLKRLPDDIHEIDAIHEDVAAHKASQFPYDPQRLVLVEDSALHVEGADIGVHVKHRIGDLQKLVGRPATWVVLIAYRRSTDVVIFRGQVSGRIVERHSHIDCFDGWFMPDELMTSGPNPYVMARQRAAEALLRHDVHAIVPTIEVWHGAYQAR